MKTKEKSVKKVFFLIFFFFDLFFRLRIKTRKSLRFTRLASFRSLPQFIALLSSHRFPRVRSWEEEEYRKRGKTKILSQSNRFLLLFSVLEEKEIFKRERGSGYFTVLPYCLSLLLVQLPLIAVLAFIGAIVCKHIPYHFDRCVLNRWWCDDEINLISFGV